jgi:hypothetical protein
VIIIGITLFFLGGLEAFGALGLGNPEVWSVLGPWMAARMATWPLLHGIVAVTFLFAAGRVMQASDLWMNLLTQNRRDETRLGPRLFGALLTGVGIYLLFSQVTEFGHLATRTTDFKTFMAAARATSQGLDPYVVSKGAYFYPPPFAHFMRPLALLPLGIASTLWLIFKCSVLVWLLVRVRNLFAEGLTVRGSRWLTFAILVGTSRFWLADLTYGNTNLLVTALLATALLDDLEDRSVRAGMALGLAVVIKVVPIVAIAGWLVCRRGRSLAATGATLVLLVGLALVMAGGQAWPQWDSYIAEGVVAKMGESLAQPDNQSLRGLLERTLGSGSSTRILWATLSLLVVSAAAALTQVARRSKDPRSRLLAVAIWPAVILLVSPGSWVVHYVNVLLPFAAMSAILVARPRTWSVLVPFALVNFAFTMSGWWRPTVRWSIGQSWFVIALILMTILIARELRRRLTRA